jgi:hypothetical protein
MLLRILQGQQSCPQQWRMLQVRMIIGQYAELDYASLME